MADEQMAAGSGQCPERTVIGDGYLRCDLPAGHDGWHKNVRGPVTWPWPSLDKTGQSSIKPATTDDERSRAISIPEIEHERPQTRAECAEGPRPCPYVSCRHHLFLDVSARTGAVKPNFPELEVWDMNETCALDVADRGGTTLEDVSTIMNLTREGVRQVEVRALYKLRKKMEQSDLPQP